MDPIIKYGFKLCGDLSKGDYALFLAGSNSISVGFSLLMRTYNPDLKEFYKSTRRQPQGAHILRTGPVDPKRLRDYLKIDDVLAIAIGHQEDFFSPPIEIKSANCDLDLEQLTDS